MIYAAETVIRCAAAGRRKKKMSKKDKKANANKTNAARMLDRAKVAYELMEYEAPEGFLDGVSVAHQTGMPEEVVFKTLVTVGHSGQNYVCCIPVAEELDLKKAAKHFGEKKIEMIHARDITATTGYIKGGCSPIGMKKPFPTVLHKTADDLEEIVVSAGRVGLQVKLKTKDLISVVGAGTDDICVE